MKSNEKTEYKKTPIEKNESIEPRITCSKEAETAIRKILDDCELSEYQEHVGILMLNNKNTVIDKRIVGIGTSNSCMIGPKEVFRSAIVKGATRIMMFHTHPSGDPAPSKDDINLTKKMTKAGEIIGITVLDHIIIANGHGYVSFLDLGML
jgi:DNA repair protein RadC